MRITQNMLTKSNLGYISKNYDRLDKIQDQINTGKKITRPSDDPVVAMKGMRYRSQLVEIKQFSRNLTEGFTWMDNADSALDETGQVIQRLRELTVQASNDSYDENDRGNIEKEISRLQEHLIAMANQKVGDNYIFNGTDTDEAPINTDHFNIDFEKFKIDTANREDYVISYQGQTYKFDSSDNKYKYTTPEGHINKISIDPATYKVTLEYVDDLKYKNGEDANFTKIIENPSSNLVISNKDAVSENDQDVEIEVMKGVTIPINIRAQDAFSIDLFGGIESIKKMLKNPETKGSEITKSLDSIDNFLKGIVSTRAELGARQNRAEMVEDRLQRQQVVAEQTVSDNEDVDFEKAIIDLTTQESIHRASLAAGARIIQPTLMDFLR